eukprot:14374505-Alexandrium_andersonii.AAC.1
MSREASQGLDQSFPTATDAANRRKPPQTAANRCKLLQTAAKRLKPPQTAASKQQRRKPPYTMGTL